MSNPTKNEAAQEVPRCICHSGSVCGPACAYSHHDGCRQTPAPVTTDAAGKGEVPAPATEVSAEQCDAYQPNILGVPEPQDRCVKASGHKGKHSRQSGPFTASAPQPPERTACPLCKSLPMISEHEARLRAEKTVAFWYRDGYATGDRTPISVRPELVDLLTADIVRAGRAADLTASRAELDAAIIQEMLRVEPGNADYSAVPLATRVNRVVNRLVNANLIIAELRSSRADVDARNCQCIVWAQHGVEHPRGHRESGCAFASPVAADAAQRHHENCAAWTVPMDGDPIPCDCGVFAADLKTTWLSDERPWDDVNPCAICDKRMPINICTATFGCHYECQPPSLVDAAQRFPDFGSLLEVVGEAGADLEAEGLNLEVADRIYERGRRDGLKEVAVDAAQRERIAQLTAHRACTNEEHDPAKGKISGFCVVCGMPWPCEVAKPTATEEGRKVDG